MRNLFEEVFGEFSKAPGRLGGASLEVAIRQQPGEKRVAIARHRVAEQHAIQSRAPRVLLKSGQIESGTVRAIDAPADAVSRDPAAHGLGFRFAQLESLAHDAAPSFEQWARELGVRKAAWQVAEGDVPSVLAHLGNWHDLLVLGRDASLPWGTPPLLGSIVLGCHLPCIVVPPGCTQPKFEMIVVAWNGSPEAIRAIHSAAPLLARAKRIVVLYGREREQFSEIGWNPEFNLARYFAREDIAFEHRGLEAGADDAGIAILAAAASQGADLLVMGAYGRTRFSEWMFGGATRHVLAEATLPVLMRH